MRSRDRMRAALGAAALAGAVTLGLAGPALAAGSTDSGATIDHVEVGDDGTVSALVGVDGLPQGAQVDLGSVTASVDQQPVDTDAETVRAGQIQRTTVLALDASKSMRGARFAAAKQAAKAFIDAAPDDVRIGLLTFSGKVHDVTEPTTDHASLVRAIDGIDLTLGTSVYDAVVRAVDLTGTEGARSVLLLSDGEDQGKGAPISDAVAAATDHETTVDVVAIQQRPQSRELLGKIADASGGRVIPADQPSALKALFTAQAEALAHQVLVTFPRPEDVADEASVQVSLQADGETYSDTAFVPLGRPAGDSATGSGPEPFQVQAPLLSGVTWLWVGALVLGLGLAGLLVALLTRPSRKPTLAQQQLAHYSGQTTSSTPQSTKTRTSLRDSAVAVAEKAVAGDFETRLTQRLNGAGVALTAAEWLLVHAGVAVGSAAVGFILGGAAFMVLLLLVGAVGGWAYLRFKHARRLSVFNGQLAETLGLISGGLSAGLSLPQAIDTVVREGNEPMAGEMRRALAEQRLGVDMSDALDGVADRMSSEDFRWVVMAMRIQREVGGNLAELLLTVSDTLREREYLRRQVKTLSAEGRMSAYILGALPVGIFGYLAMFRPDYVRPLYTEPLGMLLLAAAVVLLGVGGFAMSRLVKVEV